jgi:hypothetical protein
LIFLSHHHLFGGLYVNLRFGVLAATIGRNRYAKPDVITLHILVAEDPPEETPSTK